MSKRILIGLIRLYQWTLSPLLGSCCRFHPSCSEYCTKAIERYGAWKGLRLGLKRILKCGPWNKGGVDEVP